MDADALKALDKLFQLASVLAGLMQRNLDDRGLTPARAELLLVLHEGGPMVQRQISDALRCTPRHVTALVDALEGQGWVSRRPHPTDRRAIVVAPTKRGTAAATKMAADRREGARWLLGDVSQADLGTFVAIADQVIDRIASITGESPGRRRPRARHPAGRPKRSSTLGEET